MILFPSNELLFVSLSISESLISLDSEIEFGMDDEDDETFTSSWADMFWEVEGESNKGRCKRLIFLFEPSLVYHSPILNPPIQTWQPKQKQGEINRSLLSHRGEAFQSSGWTLPLPSDSLSPHRIVIARLFSTAGTGYVYTTRRPRVAEKLQMMKYDPKGQSQTVGIGQVKRETRGDTEMRWWEEKDR